MTLTYAAPKPTHAYLYVVSEMERDICAVKGVSRMPRFVRGNYPTNDWKMNDGIVQAGGDDDSYSWMKRPGRNSRRL